MKELFLEDLEVGQVYRTGTYVMTAEEIKNGAWEENEKRQDALGECDSLYFERPENIEVSLFAFIKANRARIDP